MVISHLNNRNLPASTRSEFDYDGCMKVTLEIPAQPTRTLQGLDLVIPIKDSEAPLMHVCGEGLRSNYAGYIPAGQGVVWTSAHASRDQLIGTFVPYIFVGGPERGLVWFASNDRDWSVDPTN
ncbi:MAG: hypothetical protein M3Y56_03350, partial [Armatimonadota bacterium]|nr:hypothetical protein [Armatimonadota bacterium]